MLNYGIRGQITWFYYRDLPAAMKWYEDKMGFKLVVDQGWSKIYKVTGDAYLGLVDQSKGYHRANEVKPVIFCINVINADEWYDKLVQNGVKIEKKPKESETLKVKVFMLKDPEGYVVEIQESLPGALSI